MKLRNKITGEIKNFDDIQISLYIGGQQSGPFYDSIAELNEEYEDYEEPKEYWYISDSGRIVKGNTEEETHKEIGNYFETKEQADKALEKLKAWKRLKDKGFRFNCWYGGSKDISFSIPQEIIDTTTAKDLDLLFRGEE
jgi:hypothetical protein